jgi:hypothetical protein
MGQSVADLVQDWGGFEDLVKELNRTGTVTVERNVTLLDRNGSPRQIDVVLRHRQGLVEHLVLCECKFWKRTVSRRHVENLATSVTELRADRGIMFTTVGYQEGALTYAEANGVELYKVREVTDQEWGGPGRIATFNQRYIIRAIRSGLQLQALGQAGVAIPDIDLGNVTFHGAPTRHEMIVGGGPVTLEEILDADSKSTAGLAIAQHALSPPELIFGGSGGDRLFALTVVLVFPQGAHFVERPEVQIATMTYQLGILIHERHLTIDRSNAFSLVLALEDCVRRTVTTATRRPGQETTTLKLQPPNASVEIPALANNVLWVMWVNFFELFDRFEGLEYLRIYDQPASSPSADLT